MNVSTIIEKIRNFNHNIVDSGFLRDIQEYINTIAQPQNNQNMVLLKDISNKDDTIRARQNVIHEAGLFQGKLGFKKTILLMQEGVEGFTNVDGLQYIPFVKENIETTFYELQRVLKRENQING
jgi:predicted nucleotide-binding protein